jgi:CBS domain-containing protein
MRENGSPASFWKWRGARHKTTPSICDVAPGHRRLSRIDHRDRIAHPDRIGNSIGDRGFGEPRRTGGMIARALISADIQNEDMTMRVKDVMTPNVICIGADEPILKAARLMLQNRISGLPVIDKDGELVGIVTEGDFLRRSELGTQRQRPKWLEFIVGPGRLAQEYTQSSGRKVEAIMTPDPRTIGEDEMLEAVVDTMERHHVKRLPVTRGGRVVGIISRANLMHALASLTRDIAAPAAGDLALRDQILAAIGKQDWAPRINVIVSGGVAELHGVITDNRERAGLIVAAENVPGVKRVRDHLVWVEPMSGMAFPSSEDEANDRAAV